ncbi:MAG: hypothetical protein ABSD46_02945 [Bacteroidota bacterium]
MSDYIFDTNCFYAVSTNNDRQKKLKAFTPPPSTSIIAPLEIIKISDDANDFCKRKRAIDTLTTIGTTILSENPESIIRQAFGLPAITEAIPIEKMIRALTLANSYDEATTGVKDFKNNVIIKLHPAKIKEWKNDLSSYFTQAVVSGNKKMQSVFLDRLKELHPDAKERGLKKISKNLTALSNEQLHSRNNAIAGLSVRAGLFTVQQLTDALQNNGMEELIQKAVARYNGLVDSYISMYLAFQKKMSDGRTPERNTLFDLEFFTHLDTEGVNYTFVTTEYLWLELGEQALPNRIVHLDTLFND